MCGSVSTAHHKQLNNMSTPIVYDYKGSQISFISGENVMVNATQMARPFGKLAKDWLSNKSTKEFLSTLSAVRTISLTGLVDKVFKIISFLFGGLRNCCNFTVLQLTINYANGIFYTHKGTILKYRQAVSVYHRPMAMVGCSKLGYLSAFLFNNK